MANYLLTLLSVALIIVVYGLFVGLYDRQYKSMAKKRNLLVGIIVVSSGIFSAMITSSYYIDGLNIKYLAPILLFVVATAALVIYTCLLKKIYAKKTKIRNKRRRATMRRMTDKTIKTGNDDINNDFEKFVKWSKIRTVTRIFIWVCWIGLFLLAMLKEFIDFEQKAPFLFGKIFAGISLAVVVVLVTLETICSIKTRKYIKQIEEIENEENEDKTNER